MRSTTVGGSVILAALLLGAPGCASAGPVGEPPIATASLEPATAVGPSGGGLSNTCGKFMSLPSNTEMIGIVLLLSPVIVVVAPFLLAYAVVGTPLRVLTRRR